MILLALGCHRSGRSNLPNFFSFFFSILFLTFFVFFFTKFFCFFYTNFCFFYNKFFTSIFTPFVFCFFLHQFFVYYTKLLYQFSTPNCYTFLHRFFNLIGVIFYPDFLHRLFTPTNFFTQFFKLKVLTLYNIIISLYFYQKNKSVSIFFQIFNTKIFPPIFKHFFAPLCFLKIFS